MRTSNRGEEQTRVTKFKLLRTLEKCSNTQKKSCAIGLTYSLGKGAKPFTITKF